MAREIYKVKSGENLTVIAEAALGDRTRWTEIAALNNLTHPYIIYPGQVLELPAERESEITEVELPTAAALATERAGFSFSPATVMLLVAGAALLFFTQRR